MANSTAQMDDERKLSKWNDEIQMVLLPNTIFLAVCGVIGILGNSIVLLVYRTLPRKKYIGRFFVPYLAAADLVTVLVTAGLSIYNNIYPVTYTSQALCSFGSFLSGSFTIWSMTLLVLIAFQRYRKICRPNNLPISRSRLKISALVSFCVSLLLNVLFIFTWDLQDAENNTQNITGKQCGFNSEKLPTFYLIHTIILCLYTLASCVVMIMCYVLIGIFMYRNWKTRVNFAEAQFSKNTRPVRFFKTTVMFMIITIIFLLSYIPTAISINNKSSEETETLLHRFLSTFFLVNHIVNAFIYAFMDEVFSGKLRKLFSCCENSESTQLSLSERTTRDTNETNV